MRKFITALALGALACGMTSCYAGPHQLKRSVDDWDHKMYVESPWLNGVLWFIPVFPLAHFVAGVGDFFITDAYAFWFKDAWDGKGTGFERLQVEATDGRMSSLLNEGSGWLQIKE